MIIGVPKEIKNKEARVALTPAGAMALIKAGHHVKIETDAGIASGFTNQAYEEVGAELVPNPADVWSAEMIMKVKEPLQEEYQFFREGLILFTYLHLAPAKQLTDALLENGVLSIAYESVQLEDCSLPLLKPMSEVAGRMAVQIGAQFLQKPAGGQGVLLAGVPGVDRGEVVIIGGGVAGMNAAKIAIGLGAKVTILDVNPERLAELDNIFGSQVQTMMSSSYAVKEKVAGADLVIGAVLIPGHRAPKLVTEEIVKVMKSGSVIVDVAIDQGGIFETVDKVTTHDEPTYVKHDVVHYAVANMPGAVPRTSTFALTNSTLPYALKIANQGAVGAIQAEPAIYKGVNTIKGALTIKEVAEDQKRTYTPLAEVL